MSEPKVTERISVTVSVEYEPRKVFNSGLLEEARRLAEHKAGAACFYTGHSSSPDKLTVKFNAAKGGSS